MVYFLMMTHDHHNKGDMSLSAIVHYGLINSFWTVLEICIGLLMGFVDDNEIML